MLFSCKRKLYFFNFLKYTYEVMGPGSTETEVYVNNLVQSQLSVHLRNSMLYLAFIVDLITPKRI